MDGWIDGWIDRSIHPSIDQNNSVLHTIKSRKIQLRNVLQNTDVTRDNSQKVFEINQEQN